MRLKYKLFIMTLIIFSSLFCYINVDALSIGRVNNEKGIKVMSGPGTNYSESGTLSYFDVVPLISTTKETGSGCSSGWYKINYNGTTRYVCSLYISISNNTINANDKAGVNLRNGAGTNYAIYKRVVDDKPLTLIQAKQHGRQYIKKKDEAENNRAA